MHTPQLTTVSADSLASTSFRVLPSTSKRSYRSDSSFFFFNDTATTEIYTLSLHDALPICRRRAHPRCSSTVKPECRRSTDRKSTRLNSSHVRISYAVFCLKKKKKVPAILSMDIYKKNDDFKQIRPQTD